MQREDPHNFSTRKIATCLLSQAPFDEQLLPEHLQNPLAHRHHVLCGTTIIGDDAQ